MGGRAARSQPHVGGAISSVEQQVEARAAAHDLHIETLVGERRRVHVELDGVTHHRDALLEVRSRGLQLQHPAAHPGDRALKAVGLLSRRHAHVPATVVEPHPIAEVLRLDLRLAHQRVLGIERAAAAQHQRDQQQP
jgi:hypothetical protein